MIYPNFGIGKNDDRLYYAEFDRGEPNSFTIFQRSFIFDEEEFPEYYGGREGHPYQLFSGSCREGGIPDVSFVKFMIDALNEKLTASKS